MLSDLTWSLSVFGEDYALCLTLETSKSTSCNICDL